uniref:Putative small hydrophobic protein n=1 Tax=Mammalian orthorubulavirus 5 TaxID=2560580 RepID=A0A6B9UKN8_9MONO|nr:putative small hydrophobic protein [Mammalian orthorubulavirus 5]
MLPDPEDPESKKATRRTGNPIICFLFIFFLFVNFIVLNPRHLLSQHLPQAIHYIISPAILPTHIISILKKK